MKIVIDIPNPPSEQRIINIPIHFCGGQVVDAGGYGFEERKTGKWNLIETHNCYEIYQCDKCKRIITVFHRFGGMPTVADVTVDYPYCHCGAKMEVDE